MSSGITRAAIALLTVLTASAAWAEDLKPICPDRPGRGTSPCTLEAGHAQLELGLFDDSFQHRSGVTTDTDNVGSLLAKWGVNDRMDVEAGMALYQYQRVHDATGTTTMSGVGDLFLHGKYNLLPGDGAFALVLDPFLKLPTATGGLGNGAVEGGFVLPMSYDLGHNWSLAMTPEADIQLNASGSGTHVNLVDVVGLGKSFGAWTLGAEVWTDQNLDPAGTIRQYSFDLDAAWLAGNDMQLDGGVNIGLNRATPDLEFYFGISRRF
ncbi:MAG TPA: transporter [Rhizomicrobium sp.]|nr:transporter [Rhizomicrobium sp.]